MATITVPILFGERLLGVLHSHTTQPGRRFTPDDLRLLQMLAAQAAIAIENARLYEATERAARETRSLYEVAHTLTTSLDPMEVLHLISVKTTELLGTPHAQVVLWDEDTRTLRLGAAHGTQAEKVKSQEFRLGKGVNGTVAETRAPLIVNDYQAFPKRVPGMTELVAVIGVPLLYRGRLLGCSQLARHESGVGVHREPSRPPHQFCGPGGHRYRERPAIQREQARRRQLEALQVVTAEIIRELDLTNLLETHPPTRRVEFDQGRRMGRSILWEEAAQVLVPRAWTSQREWLRKERLRLGERVAGTVAERRQGMVVNGFRTSPYATAAVLEQTTHTAVLAEPLLYRDRLIGVVTMNNEGPDSPSRSRTAKPSPSSPPRRPSPSRTRGCSRRSASEGNTRGHPRRR